MRCMKKDKFLPDGKPVKERSLLSKIMISMIIMGFLEVIIFAVIMLASGELSYIKK